MDKPIKVIKNVGEVGIDTDASPGNGCYYVKHYATGYDVCGFDSVEEALIELEYLDKNQDEIESYTSAGGQDIAMDMFGTPVSTDMYGMH